MRAGARPQLSAARPARLGRWWAWRREAAILLVLIALHLGAVGAGPLNPMIVAIGVLGALWLMERLATPFAAWRPGVFMHLCLLFGAVVLLSAFGRQPGEILEGVVTFLPKLFLAIVLADLLTDRARAEGTLFAMLMVAALVALCALLQVGVFLLFDAEYTLADEFFRYSFLPDFTLLRATAFARTANQFAPPILVAGVSSLMLAACRPAGPGQRWLLLCGLLDLAAVALSMVRGAWLALLLCAVVLPLAWRPARLVRWGGLLLFGVVLAWAGGAWHWLAAGSRAMLTSFNGVGINNFAAQSPTFEAYPVHNAFLQVGSELGIPGLLVFLAVLGWVGGRLVRAATVASPFSAPFSARVSAAAVAGGMFALLVLCSSEPLAYSQFLWIYLALCDAVARHVLATRVQPARPEPGDAPRIPREPPPLAPSPGAP